MRPVTPNMSRLISESDPEFDQKANSLMTEAVARAKRSLNKTPDETLAELGAKPEIRAKYKIEVMFEKDRTTLGPNLLGIQLWESGRMFHGGGDQLMYWCMDTETNMGCKAPISGDFIQGDIIFCPSCQRTILGPRSTNMRVLRVTTKVLAEELASLFVTLGHNADIYLKYHKTDVHYLAMEKAKGNTTAKRLKGMHIYPLKNILKDTANGAEISGRFFAFLTS